MSFLSVLFQQHPVRQTVVTSGGVIEVAHQTQTLERAAGMLQDNFYGQSQEAFSVPKNVQLEQVIIDQTIAWNGSTPFDFGAMIGRTPNLSNNPYCGGGS